MNESFANSKLICFPSGMTNDGATAFLQMHRAGTPQLYTGQLHHEARKPSNDAVHRCRCLNQKVATQHHETGCLYPPADLNNDFA